MAAEKKDKEDVVGAYLNDLGDEAGFSIKIGWKGALVWVGAIFLMAFAARAGWRLAGLVGR